MLLCWQQGLLYNSICENTYRVSAWPWRRRSHYGPSRRREFHLVACQKARIFQQHSRKHVRCYITVDSQVYRCCSVVRDCSKKVGFWDLPNFVSFRAVWELIFSMASLRYQGLSDFQYWQTQLGACFLNWLNYSPSGDWHPSKSHLKICFLPVTLNTVQTVKLYRKIIHVCAYNHTKRINTLRWENCRVSFCNNRWYV